MVPKDEKYRRQKPEDAKKAVEQLETTPLV
jgi:hypothetical protein